ncbi:MAG: T9SS type A sorting domain-containing protein [Prevotella sp.]|nr:T9SS type A sorting domain-containing protein [Prevotella sp.]
MSIDNSSNSINVTITADNNCLDNIGSLDDLETNTNEMLQRLDWTLEIFNTATGEKVVTQNVSGNYISLNTSGWKRGLYAVCVTVGKEILTEKVIVK